MKMYQTAGVLLQVYSSGFSYFLLMKADSNVIEMNPNEARQLFSIRTENK